MNKIDLQIHTYHSDGKDSVKDIFVKAKDVELKLFSITDHNYISPEVCEFANSEDFFKQSFIQGVEVSAIDPVSKTSFHVLGYSRSFDIPNLNKDLEPVIRGYNERGKIIIDKINSEYKTSFGFEELLLESQSQYLSRNFLAEKVLEVTNYKLTFKEAVDYTFIAENSDWMLSPKEAIDIIIKNGGIPVWAHPGNFVMNNTFSDWAVKLIGHGLMGIEATYPKFSTETKAYLHEFAKTQNLLRTGGSDWHGMGTGSDEIGITVDNDNFNELLRIFN